MKNIRGSVRNIATGLTDPTTLPEQEYHSTSAYVPRETMARAGMAPHGKAPSGNRVPARS